MAYILYQTNTHAHITEDELVSMSRAMEQAGTASIILVSLSMPTTI